MFPDEVCAVHEPANGDGVSKLAESDPRPMSPRGQSYLFIRGFKQGAGALAQDPQSKDFAAYQRGYKEGYQAASKATFAFNQEVGYVPSILRTTTEAPAPPAEGPDDYEGR